MALVILWILAMADFTITGLGTSARALLAAIPPASIEATASKGELVTEWLKITLVPLLVFLIGACLWRCIKSMLSDNEGSLRNGGVDSARTVDGNNASRDLEAGLELSHPVAEMAIATSTNVESTDEAAATGSTSTNETTSDIGNDISAECE